MFKLNQCEGGQPGQQAYRKTCFLATVEAERGPQTTHNATVDAAVRETMQRRCHTLVNIGNGQATASSLAFILKRVYTHNAPVA
ncbi:hypothetical protein HC256_010112 [Beauveria bassiana]|nr:hypothetical protein HC256_010112 [Beauveria bassiana]